MYTTQDQLHYAIHCGDEKTVHKTISFGMTRTQASIALGAAAEAGKLAFLQALLPYANPAHNDGEALFLATSHKHIACMDVLIPAVGLKTKPRALIEAASNGWAEGVQRLVGCSCVAEAWKVLREGTDWLGIDTLAEHVDPQWWTAVFEQAPPEAIPHLNALRLAQGLAEHLSVDEAPATRRLRL